MKRAGLFLLGLLALLAFISCPAPVDAGGGGVDDEPPMVLLDQTPTLFWQSVDYVSRTGSSWQFQIAADEDFTDILFESPVNPDYMPGIGRCFDAGLKTVTTYYRRARAHNGDGIWGQWSNTSSFDMTMTYTDPSGVVLGTLAGDDIETADTTPTISFTPISGLDTYYQVQIADTEQGLADAPIQGTGSSSTLTIAEPLALDSVYYWRVRAGGASINYGAWSPTYTLTVTTGAIIVTGLSPANSSTTTDTTPTFSWTAVDEATGYEVQLDDAALTDATPTISVAGTSYTPSAYLTNNTTYNWRVRAQIGGSYGSWSATHTVAVTWGAVSSLIPNAVSPPVTVDPLLSWPSVAGAVGYEVQIAEAEADVASSVEFETPTQNFATSGVDRNETRYWRVRAVDADGQFGAWSAIVSFTVPQYLIGDTGPAGGIVFYDKGTASDGWRYLEAAPSDQSTGIEWDPRDYLNGITTVDTDMEIGTGEANTALIVSAIGAGAYAAQVCADLELGGQTDWFLPSRDELNQMYLNRATIGGFASDSYWSSSELSTSTAMRQSFVNGAQDDTYKAGEVDDTPDPDTINVRAIRAFE